jgi:hypothetical protein
MPPLAIAATMGGIRLAAPGIAAVKQFTPEFHRHLHSLGDRVRNTNVWDKAQSVPLHATGSARLAIHWSPPRSSIIRPSSQ